MMHAHQPDAGLDRLPQLAPLRAVARRLGMSLADLRDACWQRGIRVWQLGRRYWIAADDVERLLTPWTPEPAVTGERFADRVERAAGIAPPRRRACREVSP